MKEHKRNIIDIFDPYNLDHLKAYQHLSKYGVWPDDSWIEYEYQSAWQNRGKEDYYEKDN